MDWTAILVALLGSNLVLEIWKTIKESIQKRKKLDVASEIDKLFKLIEAMNGNYVELSKKLDDDYKRFGEIEHELEIIKEVLSRNSKGTVLSLQNDSVLFNALRNNHINGESELQEKKLDAYYKECAAFNFDINNIL